MKYLIVEKSASKGYAMGKAYIVQKQSLDADKYPICSDDVDTEIRKYREAVKDAALQLEKLAKTDDILMAHLEMVQDPAFSDGVIEKIKSLQNAQLAVDNTANEFAAIFDAMEDEYMKERGADVRDVRNRLMRSLKGIKQDGFKDINSKVILIAEDLAPSDMSNINLDYVLGIATEYGGVTSHVSIMARNLGLPALVGVKDLTKEVDSEDYLILDASAGKIIINPDQETIDRYKALDEEYRRREKELKASVHLPAVTPDGRTVKVYANVGNIFDIQNAANNGIKGIGLFRTETLYMESAHFPTEDEQFEVYKKAAILCPEEVTIRTLDIGGDKSLPYYQFDHEDNPFLGWRAIRMSLELKDIFKTQLRAILRASAFGRIRIMYPMIASLEELEEANEILMACKEELTQSGIVFDPDIKAGIMIETPAAVLCADALAEHADFFSIGTNDLTQYVLAVDRGNKKIARLYDPFHPAVIRSIKHVIESGHARGIEVGMCGELAGNADATVLLLGLGLDEFSMSVSEIASIKDIIRRTPYKKAAECAEKAASACRKEEVRNILNGYNCRLLSMQ